LFGDIKLSAAFTYRREKNVQVSANPDNPYATTPSVGVDPGLDGLTGTADDGTFQYFERLSAANRTLITNDPTRLLSYKGLEITGTKRLSNRWQMLAGYTWSTNRQDDASIDTSPNLLINSSGVITTAANGVLSSAANADRPHQFKLTGSYLLPYQDILLSANFRSQSGPPVTRQISQRLALGGNQTINLEPLGSTRLDRLNTVDLRVSKNFRMGTRELAANLDLSNLTNANTVWEVRTLTPSITVRQNGDPNGTLNRIPQFLSPTQVLGPRIMRLGVSFKF
jgi:hypothetical protein